MSRTKFGPDSAHLTKWLPAGEIDIDPTVQRPLNVAWAERIGRELDPDLIGVIHVSKRSNGRYVAIDGQHRLYGVKKVFGNNGTLVECKVYEGLTKAQEAATFCGINNFKRPNRIDFFLKGIVSKNKDAVAINEIAQSCGFKVDRNKADGNITAIGALEDVYYGFGNISDPNLTDEQKSALAKPELLRMTLRCIREAWGGTADSVSGVIVSGVGRVLAARHRAMNVADLTHKLGQYPGGPNGLVGSARGKRTASGGTVSTAVAELCIELYNRGRRVGRIEPLR